MVVNSESLRAEVEHYLKVDAPEAQADLRSRRPRAVQARRCRTRPARGSHQYGITKPFVLFVSSLWPYKNYDGLLRAWARAAASSGIANWRSSVPVRRNTSPSCIRSRPNSVSLATWCSSAAIPVEETVAFYRAADVLAYPSLQRDLRPSHPRGYGLRLSGGHFR